MNGEKNPPQVLHLCTKTPLLLMLFKIRPKVSQKLPKCKICHPTSSMSKVCKIPVCHTCKQTKVTKTKQLSPSWLWSRPFCPLFPLPFQRKALACRLPTPQGMELASGEFPSISAPPRPHGRTHLWLQRDIDYFSCTVRSGVSRAGWSKAFTGDKIMSSFWHMWAHTYTHTHRHILAGKHVHTHTHAHTHTNAVKCAFSDDCKVRKKEDKRRSPQEWLVRRVMAENWQALVSFFLILVLDLLWKQ